MDKTLRLSISPHIHSGNSTAKIMRDVIIALVPASIAGTVIFGIRALANGLGAGIGNTVLFLCFFSVATPLGLNSVVFPEAYGGDPEPGAAMALVSHTLCVLTIPLMFALATLLFGTPNI